MDKGQKLLLLFTCSAVIMMLMGYWALTRNPFYLYLAGAAFGALVFGFVW